MKHTRDPWGSSGESFAAARASPFHPGDTGWVLLSHPCGSTRPTGRGNTPGGSPAPQFEHPALCPRFQLPRLPVEWLQEPVRRLSLGKRPANGSQGPPDVPPSFPLKEKCPSELPSTLMHGAGGGAAKSQGEQNAFKPLGKDKEVPGGDPNLCCRCRG